MTAEPATTDNAWHEGYQHGLTEASKEAQAELLKRTALGAYREVPNRPDESDAGQEISPTRRSDFGGEEPELFRRYSITEMLAEPDEFEWLAKGLLCWPTYGMLAGEMKTLKSYLAGFITVGIAAEKPVLGQFDVPYMASGAVLSYVGEGGRRLYKRRLARIAEGMGLDMADLPIHASFDTAPVLSGKFAESLQRDLEELDPALVVIDPYYAFHGAKIKAADLHAEATILNAAARPCLEANADLLVVNHFNQTGSGSGLKRITMAAGGEWSDSWILLNHREDPDVENGTFQLTIDIGSRQWGGTSWELDINIGHFDEDLGAHDGQITWDLRRATKTGGTRNANTSRRDVKLQTVRTYILEVLTDLPWQLTKTEIFERVGGHRDTAREALNSLADEGRIVHNKVGRSESGVVKTRLLWGVADNPDQTIRSDFPPTEAESAF